jgi:Cof subfamily protein (haloacid dehalogenase superfamily)
VRQLPSSFPRLESILPFSHIRLIALDIDGTLAKAANEPVAEFVSEDLLSSLKHYGVLVTVATGRAFAGVGPIIAALSNEGAPVILYNGAIVADRRGQTLYHRTAVSAPTVAKLVEIAATSQTHLLVYNCYPMQQSLIDKRGKGIMETVVGWAPEPIGSVDLNGLPILWQSYGDTRAVTEATAALFSTHDGNVKTLLANLTTLADVSITSSGSGYIEVKPAGVSKAQGLTELIKLLGLDEAEVLAVGDNDNDAEMLAWAGIGVVVANATPNARAAADYVTARASVHGVIETLRLVRNARRLFRDERGRRLRLHEEK